MVTGEILQSTKPFLPTQVRETLFPLHFQNITSSFPLQCPTALVILPSGGQLFNRTLLQPSRKTNWFVCLLCFASFAQKYTQTLRPAYQSRCLQLSSPTVWPNQDFQSWRFRSVMEIHCQEEFQHFKRQNLKVLDFITVLVKRTKNKIIEMRFTI